jgi:hypothetical protein
MIVDYELSAKYRPTDRAVWLMSKKMEEDGLEVNRSILRALETGEIKYVDHMLYKLCRGCLEYKPLEEFYTNKRFVMDRGYICKSCSSIRRRIKKYGTVGHISEVGMNDKAEGFTMNLSESTKEILKRRLDNVEIDTETTD